MGASRGACRHFNLADSTQGFAMRKNPPRFVTKTGYTYTKSGVGKAFQGVRLRKQGVRSSCHGGAGCSKHIGLWHASEGAHGPEYPLRTQSCTICTGIRGQAGEKKRRRALRERDRQAESCTLEAVRSRLSIHVPIADTNGVKNNHQATKRGQNRREGGVRAG